MALQTGSSVWFFLSYSRLDRKYDQADCIKRFYEDLNQEICRKMQIREGTAGFFDTAGIEHGDFWPDALGAALARSRTFICLYSGSYFSSEYCGKEFAAFNTRLTADGGGSEQLRTRTPILPVLLDAPQDLPKLPSIVTDIQLFDDTYPSVYREEGLLYLLRRTSQELQDKYRDFLDTLVRKILRSAQECNLAPLDRIPDINTLGSSFHVRPNNRSESEFPLRTSTGVGPRCVQFFFVAGTRDELRSVKNRVDDYGDEGEFDWRPYTPQSEDDIGMLAQSVATKERFHYQHTRLGEDFLRQLKFAQEKRRLAVIIVDTWTLQVSRYKNLMRQFDDYNFWNLAVIVAWNDEDVETLNSKPALRSSLRKTFVNKLRMQDPLGFIDGISSVDALTSRLSAILQRIRMQIIEVCDDLRTVDAERMIQKPEVSGPSGSAPL
jgi:FxsC-like protein